MDSLLSHFFSRITQIQYNPKPIENHAISFQTGPIELYTSHNKNNTHKNSSIHHTFASAFSAKNFWINEGFLGISSAISALRFSCFSSAIAKLSQLSS